MNQQIILIITMIIEDYVSLLPLKNFSCVINDVNLNSLIQTIIIKKIRNSRGGKTGCPVCSSGNDF